MHGISEDTVYSIKRVVDDIVSKARRGAKIRFSVDNKNAKTTEFVSAILRYMRCKPYAENYRQILNSKGK